jgi:hypothetical protein
MNLHTRSNPTTHSPNGTVSINIRNGGSLHHSPQTNVANSNSVAKSNINAMSQVSKSSAMLKNLKMGLEYTNHQYSSLSEIDKLFTLMSKEGCFSNEMTFRDNIAQDIIFTDSLRNLTYKRFSNIPLFGIGDESPVKIHLNFRRGREVYSIQPIPLLSAPGFSSFMKSGFNRKKPDSHFLDSILHEILSFMIMTSNNTKEISSLIEEVTFNSNHIAQLYKAQACTTPKSGNTFLSKLIQCISFSN